MKCAGFVAAIAISTIPLLAAPQKESGAAFTPGKAITLRGCVMGGVEKDSYILTQLSEATRGGQTALPESAKGRRVVFWFDKKNEMLKHVNQAVEVTGTINGVEDSEIEVKKGDARDGGVVVEFEGPGKDVRAPNLGVGAANSPDGGAKPDSKNIKTLLVRVNLTSVTVSADYPCAAPK